MIRTRKKGVTGQNIMKDKETEALKKRLEEMTFSEKVKYFFSYYTPHFLLCVLAVFILISGIIYQVRKKNAVLCLAFANTSVGSVMESRLTDGFLEDAGFSRHRNEVILYKDLYLSADASPENHEYAYASQLKLMASIEAKKLDLVLMNREAYDYLSRRGFLLDLTELLSAPDSAAAQDLAPFITENEVTISDNSVDNLLGNTDELLIQTAAVSNGILVNDLPAFRDAGFPADVWLGIIANTSHRDTVLQYLQFLQEEALASGTNDKAGSATNMMRWVSQRTVKEVLVPEF